MDIFDWYFKQIVTQGQMDWAFDRVQSAIQGLSVDNGMPGIVDGLAISEHSTPPDKTVDIAGPGTAYDKAGQRCYVPDALTVVDCSKDEFGTDSNPPTPTYQRYISVFIRFDRNLTDPALDGNNITVYTKQLESFEIFVRLGAEAPAGTATPAPLMADATLLVDILVTSGFTAIVNGDLDFSRREDFVRFSGAVIGDRVYGTAKDAIADILSLIESWGGSLPFSFSQNWFGGATVKGPTPPPATMQDALNGIVFDLAQAGAPPTVPISGSELIGARNGAGFTYVTNWTGQSVNGALFSIAGDLDAHVGGSPPQHASSAITSVAIAGSPDSLGAGTVLSQLTAALGLINARARKAVDETITGYWTITGGNMQETQNHRFLKAPYTHTQLGGSAPLGSTIEMIARQIFPSSGEGAWWGGARGDANTIDLGSMAIIGPVLGKSTANFRTINVFQRTNLVMTPIDPRTLQILVSSGSLASTLPSTTGNWDAEAVLSDGDYMYVMFTEDGVGAGTERHYLQAYSLAASTYGNVKSGWPATGRQLPGAAPTTGTHPDRGSTFGEAIPRMCFASETQLVTLNTWVPVTSAAQPALSVVNLSDGSIAGYGAGDAPTGANMYPGNGIVVDTFTNNIWFNVRDNVTNVAYIATASLATPSNPGSGVINSPYTFTEADADFWAGPLFYDGSQIWCFVGEWNTGHQQKIYQFSRTNANPNTIVEQQAGGFWDGHTWAMSRLATDGINLWIAVRKGSFQAGWLKLPLTGFDTDTFTHYLEEYPDVTRVQYKGASTYFSMPDVGGLCFCGDAMWMCPNTTTSGVGVGEVVRLPLSRMRG